MGYPNKKRGKLSEMPRKSMFFECSECSEMNFALTPTLGGYNQWICGLDHSGSQPFICACMVTVE